MGRFRFRFSLATLIVWSFLAGGFLWLNMRHELSDLGYVYGFPFSCTNIVYPVHHDKWMLLFNDFPPYVKLGTEFHAIRVNVINAFGNIVVLASCMVAVNWLMNRRMLQGKNHA